MKDKAAMRQKSSAAAYTAPINNERIIDWCINLVEDERTGIERDRDREAQHVDKSIVQPPVLEKGWGLGSMSATAKSGRGADRECGLQAAWRRNDLMSRQ